MVGYLHTRKVVSRLPAAFIELIEQRRLAAATGNPFGILDEAVSASLPTESPGFFSITALNFNIKLAKRTGQIMQSKQLSTHNFGISTDQCSSQPSMTTSLRLSDISYQVSKSFS